MGSPFSFLFVCWFGVFGFEVFVWSVLFSGFFFPLCFLHQTFARVLVCSCDSVSSLLSVIRLLLEGDFSRAETASSGMSGKDFALLYKVLVGKK